MNKLILLSMAAAMTGFCTSAVQAQENKAKRTLELRFLDSGLEDEDPELVQDYAYLYDASNKLVREASVSSGTSFKKVVYVYDEKGRLTQKSDHQLDGGQWWGLTCDEYTYNEDGTVKTYSMPSYNFETNELTAASTYVEYTYDTMGNVMKEETKETSDNSLFSYVEYTYDHGHIVKAEKKGADNVVSEVKKYEYNASDQLINVKTYGKDDYYSGLIEYTYNPNGSRKDMVVWSRQQTIDPNNPSRLSKEEYTYDANSRLIEKITYKGSHQNGEFKKWNENLKSTYTNDAQGNVLSYTTATAKRNMETGEFEKWKQNNRYDSFYSEELGEKVTPTGFDAVNYVSGLTFTWNAPAKAEGLTGYRFYKNDCFVASIEGNSYVDKDAKEGDSIDYYVQAVYDSIPQNISEILTVKVGAKVPDPQPENPYKITSEDRWLDSGLEDETPELRSETRYFYDSTCKLTAKSIKDEDSTKRTLYTYNASNKVASETSYQRDGETWYAGAGVEYTYNGNGTLDTETPRMYDFDGNLQDATTYFKYIYQGGMLTKKETRRTGSENLVEYTDYAYNEAGNLATVKSYNDESTPMEEIDYTYNDKNLLTQKITKSFQYTVDPDKLSNREREDYTYDANGVLAEKIVYNRSSVEGQDWIESKKYVYTVDPQSKQVTAYKESSADINMENGQFKKWKQNNRYEFAYTDRLAAEKAPAQLKGVADGEGIHLTWSKPVSPDSEMQLSGFNIYRDYSFLDSISAISNTEEIGSYLDRAVKENVTYEYFIQSVYNKKDLMNIGDQIVSVKAKPFSVDDVQMTTVVYGLNQSIQVRGNDVETVEVYSINGMQVARVNAQSDNVVVNGIERGTYIVKVVTHAGEYKQKVAVK